MFRRKDRKRDPQQQQQQPSAPDATPEAPPTPPVEKPKKGFFSRMREKLSAKDSWLNVDIGELLPGRKIDDELLEELEANLIMADVGMDVTTQI
ncbi:MAG: signal recognition particle receptor subunit alpha, partial [Pseudomonadota bacterium]